MLSTLNVASRRSVFWRMLNCSVSAPGLLGHRVEPHVTRARRTPASGSRGRCSDSACRSRSTRFGREVKLNSALMPLHFRFCRRARQRRETREDRVDRCGGDEGLVVHGISASFCFMVRERALVPLMRAVCTASCRGRGAERRSCCCSAPAPSGRCAGPLPLL